MPLKVAEIREIMRKSLSRAQDFFKEVVQIDAREFFDNPSTLRGAVHLANSLYHFHEWMFADYRNEAVARFNTKLSRPSELWSQIEKVDVRFGFIRDVANASKHVVINRQPSTSMTHFKDTYIETTGWGEGAWGEGKWGGAPAIHMLEGAQSASFDDCADRLYRYWEEWLLDLRS